MQPRAKGGHALGIELRARLQESADNRFVRHVAVQKSPMRLLFGAVRGVHGFLEFQPGVSDGLAELSVLATPPQSL